MLDEPGSSWRELLQWWCHQSERWMDDGAINQNIYETIKDEELRQRIAPFLCQLFPSYSTCEHCKWPWALVEQHTTMINPGQGAFALCEYCWKHLRRYGRDDKIRELYHRSRKRYWSDMEPCVLDAALDQDFGPSGPLKISHVHPDSP